MTPAFLAEIIRKHLEGETLTPEEQALFDQWSDELRIYLGQRMDTEGIGAAYGKFAERVTPPAKVVRFKRWRWAAAAALIILLTGGYFLVREKATQPGLAAKPIDISPGRQGAILTLSNGQKVVLDSMGNGLVAVQGGSRVLLQDGQLKYAKDQHGTPAGASPTAQMMYNTMTTPKGRQFQLQLPDGTKVWMNAASSLTYPTAFTDNERKVTVSGEVYFEVVKDAARPFRVSVEGGSDVEVLGTHFDIKAYNEEPGVQTTLLEGSVAVRNLHDRKILSPGQQATTSAASNISVRTADVEHVMAWKNGLFDFEGATLTEVMHQLTRWYDIEVVYEKGVPTFEFGGRLRRDLTLQSLLTFLQGAGVHFRIEEGRRLVVLP